VVGRTKGTEPHLYYYRHYDYRQWTPWEKVELDIKGDYLIPAVVNRRLFLFWPIFKEVADDIGDGKVRVPKVSLDDESSFTVDKTLKLLTMKMAVSDYRQGKWSPKKISKQAAQSASYGVELVRKHYLFFPVDRSDLDGRFGITFEGSSLGSDQNKTAAMSGAFEIAGCDGAPELVNDLAGYFVPVVRPEVASTGDDPVFMDWEELGFELPPQPRGDAPENDFTLQTYSTTERGSLTQVLVQTP
jgi:hypothetical protein